MDFKGLSEDQVTSSLMGYIASASVNIIHRILLY